MALTEIIENYVAVSYDRPRVPFFFCSAPQNHLEYGLGVLAKLSA